MRRYSGMQTLLFALLCTVLVFLFALGFGWIRLPIQDGELGNSMATGNRVERNENSLGTGAKAGDSSEATLATPPHGSGTSFLWKSHAGTEFRRRSIPYGWNLRTREQWSSLHRG